MLIFSGFEPNDAYKNTSLAVPGDTCSQPATPHRHQNSKWPPGGPKMANRVWKGVQLQVIGRSRQLSLNKFFDLSTPSMRKGRDGEKK